MPLPTGLMVSAAEMLVGGAGLTVLGLLRGEHFHARPGPHALLALAYLLSHVRPALATSYTYVSPVVAVILGVTLAGDPFSRVGLFAMPVILSGVVLVLLGCERS